MTVAAWALGALWAIAFALTAWILRRVVRMGEDLAVIRQQLTPAGGPALAATVNGHEIRISLNERDIRTLKEATP